MQARKTILLEMAGRIADYEGASIQIYHAQSAQIEQLGYKDRLQKLAESSSSSMKSEKLRSAI